MLEISLAKDARRARVLNGHPWVFAGELASPLPAGTDGEGLVLRDARGRFLGSGICNSTSKIVWRRYSRNQRAFDSAFLSEAIARSIARRGKESVRRLVWSEADDLPGLIADQFNDVIVMQTLTLAMDKRADEIARILIEQTGASEVLFRNDAPGRKYEGLALEIRTLSGKPLEARWMDIDGIEYYLDLASAQKTGYYLDQREQHRFVATLAKGRRVLDGFCNQGSFGLQCAKNGAKEVLGIDASELAVEQANANAERNHLSAKFEVGNLFDFFTAKREERFDLIVLDPPSFARNKSSVDGALRGYKELNLRAIRMLNPGGILATYSCSKSVSREMYMEVLADAAADANRKLRLIAQTGQPLDHPVILGVPETEYLKGAVVEVE
ncbi:MAG: class I SAM-dependent rRNA methyltransferase [Opitutales bacterium]|nr:class I SAM-dependent rRNA methyltransferase [Opitutales bacterium]